MQKISYSAIKQHLFYARLQLEQGEALQGDAGKPQQPEAFFSASWLHLGLALKKLPQVIAANYSINNFTGSVSELAASLESKGIKSPECSRVLASSSDPGSFTSIIARKTDELAVITTVQQESPTSRVNNNNLIPLSTEDQNDEPAELARCLEDFQSLLAELLNYSEEN